MRPFYFVIVVAVAAFGLRVAFTLAHRGSLDVVPRGEIAGADAVEYEQLARSVATGKGYAWPDGTPTAFRAPGLSLFLAGVYTAFGLSYPMAYLAMACLGSVGTVSAYLLARELTAERPARWAAVFTAVYPPNVYDCSYFFSEALFAPLLGLGLWLLARHVRTGGWWEAAGAGLILGYATLTRSFGILFLPLFAAFLWKSGRGWRSAALFAFGFVLVIAPWTVRNYLVFHRVVLVATNGGSTFYGANNDIVTSNPRNLGGWVSTKRLPGRDEIDAQPDEVSHDKKEWQLGLDWVKRNPAKFAAVSVVKVANCWMPFVSHPSLTRYPVLNIVSTAPFLILIAIGLARSLLARDGRWAFAVLHLTIFANLVMVVLFWGGPRFRDANAVVLMVYAVAGLWWLRWRVDVFTPAGEPTRPTPAPPPAGEGTNSVPAPPEGASDGLHDGRVR